MEIKEYEQLRKQFNPVEIPCEVCGSTDLSILQYRGRIRQAGEYGPVPVSVCNVCGFKFQNPRFPDSYYKNYYKELYREVAFGSKVPNEEYITVQQVRGGNVLKHISYLYPRPGVMLDHGCASGATMLPFQNAGWEAIGIDPHEPSVDTGVQKLGLDVRLASGEDLPLANSSLDLVISLGSLEHVYDFAKSMSEIHRTLKDGGYLFIRWRSDILWGSPYEYYNHNHYRFFTPNTWRLALSRYGFEFHSLTYDEIEGNTGAAYTIARKVPYSPTLFSDLISQGVKDDALKVTNELLAYKASYVNRCLQFLDFAKSVNNDPSAIRRAVDSRTINYKLLLGDPSWTVPRAILEAERYSAEYSVDPLINSTSNG